MMMGYVFWDILSPLSTTIKASPSQGGLGWTSAEYGFFAGSYSFFNIFLLMLFWGGILLDKAGVRFTGLLATAMMFLGAVICFHAMHHPVDQLHTIDIPFVGSMKTQVALAAIGFGIFGAGCDITGITISKIITKWFTGHELASAMGVQVALARVGTAAAISISPFIALRHGLAGILAVGVALLLAALLLFAAYVIVYDRKLNVIHITATELADKEEDASASESTGKPSLTAFILIVLLCVLFYSSIRPFLKFAAEIMVNRFQMDIVTAGWITSILPYGTIILTPLFGHIYDRFGRGATLMLLGCVITLFAHLMLMLPWTHSTAFAIIVFILLGIAFSLVPSAMWASIPQIVPYKRLGIAYAIIFYIQNIGLMLTPILVGKSIDSHSTPLADGSSLTDYTQPISIFVMLSLAASIVAAALLLTDHRQKIGLEQPNIKQAETE